VRVSADICRKQIAVQEAIAQNHPLETRRKIALAAVKAWTAEAALADKREAGHLSPLDKIDAEIALEFAAEDEEDDLPDLP
jgi:predicted transcriptional regulator